MNFLLKLLIEHYRARWLNGFMMPGYYLPIAILKAILRMVLWRLFGERVARKILDLGRNVYGAKSYWTKT